MKPAKTLKLKGNGFGHVNTGTFLVKIFLPRILRNRSKPGIFQGWISSLLTVWLILNVVTPLDCPAQPVSKSYPKIIGMYVHQHWPYNHPYAARTWSLEDWRGYADGLKQIGYNTLLIWPVLETMPDPLTPSDQASLDKIARVIDMLHQELQMRVYIALCPNVAANNAEAAKAPFEERHFFYCDTRVDPGDPAVLNRMILWREKLFKPLAAVDGVAIIDSDPGGFAGSNNAQFVNLLAEHRKMFDRLRPGIELYYWMHVGWGRKSVYRTFRPLS